MTMNDLWFAVLVLACVGGAASFAGLGVLLYRALWLPIWRRWQMQIEADRAAAQWNRIEQALAKARDRELRAWGSRW